MQSISVSLISPKSSLIRALWASPKVHQHPLHRLKQRSHFSLVFVTPARCACPGASYAHVLSIHLAYNWKSISQTSSGISDVLRANAWPTTSFAKVSPSSPLKHLFHSRRRWTNSCTSYFLFISLGPFSIPYQRWHILDPWLSASILGCSALYGRYVSPIIKYVLRCKEFAK